MAGGGGESLESVAQLPAPGLLVRVCCCLLIHDDYEILTTNEANIRRLGRVHFVKVPYLRI
jgi:hypothetical protein